MVTGGPTAPTSWNLGGWFLLEHSSGSLVLTTFGFQEIFVRQNSAGFVGMVFDDLIFIVATPDGFDKGLYKPYRHSF